MENGLEIFNEWKAFALIDEYIVDKEVRNPNCIVTDSLGNK